jgi:integrase
MRRKGNQDRTIHNKHVSVFGFFRWAGVETKPLTARAPGYTKKEVEIYEPGELKLFFDSLKNPYHRMVFDVLLKTGLRMQEAMFLEWHNFNFDRGTLTLRERNAAGFEIKDRAERTLPVPAELIERLQEWKKTHKGRLILGTRNDTPNWKWLPLLKTLVRKAGLNCGHCQACRDKNECERWYLHKFRATYITNLLRAGIDARTLMKYSGHEDLATILRYLAPAETPETQAKVNAIVWTKSRAY